MAELFRIVKYYNSWCSWTYWTAGDLVHRSYQLPTLSSYTNCHFGCRCKQLGSSNPAFVETIHHPRISQMRPWNSILLPHYLKMLLAIIQYPWTDRFSPTTATISAICDPLHLRQCDRGQAHSHAVVMGDRIDLQPRSWQSSKTAHQKCLPTIAHCGLVPGLNHQRECLRAVGMPFDSLCIEPQFPQKTALRLPTCNVD